VRGHTQICILEKPSRSFSGVVPHPTYNPDLAPSASMFWSFEKWNPQKMFDDDKEVISEVMSWL
jgi:hypothetical protein